MKRQMKSVIALLMVLVFSFGAGAVQVSAAINYVVANRSIEPQTIYLGEEAVVNLSITGTPPVNVVKPNDVILVLDKSGSMKDDNRFDTMISSAKEFIDLFDFSAHKVGVVDFSSESSIGTFPLTSNSTDVKNYIDTIQLGGGTDTHKAIEKSMELLANKREEAQPVIVLLTDGAANNEVAAKEAAVKAKEAGIVFYTIALLGPNDDPTTNKWNQLMMDMATTSRHHHFVLGSVGLMDIYRAIVKEIGISSAYDVVITETVAPQFEIVPGSYEHNIPKPKVVDNTLTWEMLELKADTINLSYKVRLKDGVPLGTYNIASSAIVSYKDYAGAKRSYLIPNQQLTIKYRPPVITGITPDKGDIAGGGTVTITGEEFREGAIVKFGSNLATDIKVLDSKTITATVPAGVQGPVTVAVINTDKQQATTTYTYTATPVITSVTPNVGPFLGGNSVRIDGQYFMKDMKVAFDGQEVSSINYYANYVIVKAPKAIKEGLVDITVTNGDGTTATLVNGYTYEPEIIERLEITNISPNQGKYNGGEIIYIDGKHIENGFTLEIGGKLATDLLFYNSTRVRAKVPAADKVGKVNVVITNPDGEKYEVVEGYEYLPLPEPTVVAITPNTGELPGGEVATITGTNFVQGATVAVGGKAATIKDITATNISIIIPEGTALGKVNVEITNPDGQKALLVEGYEYIPTPAPPELPAPEITKISPAQGKIEGGELVYIEGTNFVNGITATIGGKEAEVLNYYSPLKIRVRIPAGDVAGKVDVKVTNPDMKTATLTEGYEYLAPPEEQEPKITVLSATSGELTGGEIIYIEGENFQAGLQVEFGSKLAEVLNYYNSTKIRVRVPAGDVAGSVNVTVTNPSGKSGTVTDAYTYNAYIPSITSVSPNSGKLEGGELIYIDGKNFVNGLNVTIGGKDAEVSLFYSSTRIRVRVPASTTPGIVEVTVTNPDGASTSVAQGYEYLEPAKEPDPQIGKISLSSSVSGAAITAVNKSQIVYVHGDGFKTGAKVKFIDATGREIIASPLNIYDAKRIRVRIPADIASGAAQMIIMNTEVESAPFGFEVN